ncbi:hypothetical protein AVEN_76429-1 [Araneus ventricosus]|uniref:Uncharacterized protein n=1 Tax=Araneus ventricosus TaxID=182803 RepID=A0A4Y2W9C0_ARAVE|nr:hypothetical protein AVEN_15267-1 [Araneus ventricosus]GBO33755.1 hypothetical protein AVEN_76429-1 [Araneus ventricosus]
MPVPENTTQEKANSSSKVLINTPHINIQPAEPGTSSVKPPPTKHLHKISPIQRLRQVTTKQRIKKTAALLTSIDNRNALKANFEKRFQKCKKKDDKTIKKKFNFESGGRSHDSSSDIDECSNTITFTTPKEKNGKIKSKKAKKDARQDNNEQLDHTCEADILCKECSENYYKSKRRCDWLRCINCQMWLHEDCTIFDTFCVDCSKKNRSINK